MANLLYEVIPFAYDQKKLLEFLENGVEIGIWHIKRKSKRSYEIIIPLYFQKEFEKAFSSLNFHFKLVGRNVEVTLHEKITKSVPTVREERISFKKYHRYNEIQDYLKYLSVEYPNLVCLQNYGLSYENRSLTLAHISTGRNCHKPIIFIDAGMHAREWIAPAQALYILHSLIEREENKYLIEKVDWIIIPVVNPDGYEYTHTTDRFWRKTRSRLKNGSVGVDPNRNFDFQWMQCGASKHEVSQTYCGPSPFSEPETKFLSHVLMENSKQIKLYLSMHSFRQCIAYPFGFTKELPRNAYEMEKLATRVEEAIYQVHGNHYDVGHSFQIMRPMSGSSTDWAYQTAGIELCYTFELPGGGNRGFDLPAGAILTVVREVFAGLKVFHKYVELNYAE